MARYKEYEQLDLQAIDKEILQFWKSEKIFQKSVGQRPESRRFVFYEGPPSANGMPGIHHVMARTVKDIFCRFHTMQGQRVERKGGWDTHGLPIELSVEKELGITKEDIGDMITVEEYNRKCRETVMRYKDQWDALTEQMGYWVDLDNPYITFTNEYIESVWCLLKQIYDKGLMYKGNTIQPYSPAAGTGLSSHELNMPGTYREVKDTTVVAMFEVERDDTSALLFDNDNEDVRLLAWTTTPWTLPSNTALTVGPKLDYVKIKTTNPYTGDAVSTILVKDLVDEWFGGQNQPEILSQSEPFKGKTLEGIRFKQLLPFGNPIEELNGAKDAFRVLTGDFVTTEEGTGIVHTAPSFGADDLRVARTNGIGALTLVDKQGKFTSTVGEFSNRYVKNYKDDPDYVSVDVDIAVSLKKDGKALNVQKYEHNYPHCWRTDKPILYYPLDSWFIRSTAVKDRMIELNKTIQWKPAHTGEKRFGNWLENLQDWNLSRSRFWGIPLPIWRTEDGKEELCIGSIEQLGDSIKAANAKLSLDQAVPADLHKPYIDDVILVSPSGKPMSRESDLIDVWFDSGSMPYAQWHYPFENKEVFNQNFPADFIAEGVDQTRGWFFTLHAIATMVSDSVAYKTVVSNGLVLDKDGRKMSKRLGNAADSFATIDTYGADATRWYMISNAQPWDNLRFDPEGIDEVRRKFFGTLYNTYAFFVLYANIDGFVYAEDEIPFEERPELDRWILSKLNSMIGSVTLEYGNYEPTNATRQIQQFVDEHLSNWYVRLSRRRFWKGEYGKDKLSAYQTLYRCLSGISKLIAPVAPFFADWLFRNLNFITHKEDHESVHLALLVEVRNEEIDKALEQRMDYAQRIASLVLSLRKKEGIRVRQPLKKIMLPVLDLAFKSQVKAVKDLILSEVNVKEIEFLEEGSGVIKKQAKPNFKTLGKRLGKDMKEAAQRIQSLGQKEIVDFEEKGRMELKIGHTVYDLEVEDIEIATKDIPGLLIATDVNLTVALDVEITEDLLAEGFARELVNRIQNLRKDKDFEVTDRIAVCVHPNADIEQAVHQFGSYIRNETLANILELNDCQNGDEVEWLEGEKVRIRVDKAETN